MSITFGSITSGVGSAVQTTETGLQSQLNQISQESDPTPEELMQVQVGIQQWTLMVQVESTVDKELGDALKGVIQKAD